MTTTTASGAAGASGAADAPAAPASLHLVRAWLRVGRDGRVSAVTELAADDAEARVTYERAVLLDTDSVEALLQGAAAAEESASADA